MKTLLFLSISFFVLVTLYADSPVLKTGQTQCFDSVTFSEIDCADILGQDGNYQKGLPRVYHRFVHGVDYVSDDTLGMYWQDSGIVSDKNWTQASEYCANGAMRLPTRKELKSIVDYGVTSSGLPIDDIFEHIGSTGYWCADEYNTSQAWAIGFSTYNGLDYMQPKNTLLNVRCVWNGTLGNSTFTRNNTLETVYDSDTNLTWQDNSDVNSTSYKWNSAIEYCENLHFAGVSDWRIPNINELYMITDHTQSPTIDSTFNFRLGRYWSSTTNIKSTSRAWTVDFTYGQGLSSYGKDWSYNYARCVRDGTIETPSGFPGPVGYDSGWVDITPGEDKIITHNLGPDVFNSLIQVTSTYYNGIGDRADTYCFGGCDNINDRKGYYWHGLTENNITVRARQESNVTDIRVQIWHAPEPDYDSGWLPIDVGDSGPLLHNVGGNSENYIIDMQFSDWFGFFPHQMYYGGIIFGNQSLGGSVDGQLWGAYWHSLNSSTINVARMAQDQKVLMFRGRIWKAPHSSYDSGWKEVAQDAVHYHPLPTDSNLNTNSNAYIYHEQRDPGMLGYGVNHKGLGGYFFTHNNQGSFWRENIYSYPSIYTLRFYSDAVADQIRLRYFDAESSNKRNLNPAIIMYLLN